MRVGSSPRVRGKQRRQHHHLPPRRLIPACAGKTASSPRIARPRRAHPRVCGENAIRSLVNLAWWGSSPRVRGKLRHCEPHVGITGLIPACAGKTPWRVGAHLLPPAHPRVCGENAGRGTQSSSTAGSSPRVRGKRAVLDGGLQDGGLIPACAGKTTTGVSNDDGSQAHPRVCGENCETLAVSGTTRGSSPRVRGKLKGSSPFRSTFGLIPARAGKTSIRSYRAILTAAHPRACGENLPEPAGPEMNRGSSPRVRGKPRLSCVLPSLLGPIPARAGKTSLVVQEDSGMRAHPRACGENPRRRRAAPSRAGSSPRVRGKLGG